MMKLSSLLLSALALNADNLQQVEAFSGGAGGCNGGGPAVGGPHLSTEPVIEGVLDDGNMVLAMNNRVVDPDLDGNFAIETNTPYTLLVTNSTPNLDLAPVIRGALIRVENSDGAFTLEPIDATGQVASQAGCAAPASGVTHVDSTVKTQFGAALNVATEGSVTVDVTIVQSNNANDGSVYYHNTYTFVAAAVLPDTPTVVPVDIPATPSSPFTNPPEPADGDNATATAPPGGPGGETPPGNETTTAPGPGGPANETTAPPGGEATPPPVDGTVAPTNDTSAATEAPNGTAPEGPTEAEPADPGADNTTAPGMTDNTTGMTPDNSTDEGDEDDPDPVGETPAVPDAPAQSPLPMAPTAAGSGATSYSIQLICSMIASTAVTMAWLTSVLL